MSGPVVTGLDAWSRTIPTDVPEGDGTLTWDSTTLVVVRAHAGDAAGLGWTYAPSAAATVVEEQLAPVVEGRSALLPRSAWSAQVRAVRNAGRPGLVGMAVSAVDTALWDLCARLLEVPLTTLWGAERTSVPVYGSGGFTTYDDARLRAQLEAWSALGLPQVKIKIGESWGRHEERDLHRVRLARELLDDDVELFVDANGGYDPGQARRIGAQLEDLGVTWFEEPVSSDDLDGLRAVREALAVDVAAGEYGHDLAYFARMAAAGAVDCLQVDVTRCGGYTEWHRIAAVADALGLPLSVHCAPYLSLPAASASPGVRHIEWFHDHVRIEQAMFDRCPDPVAGELVPGDAAGHGLSLRPDADPEGSGLA